MSRVRSRLIRSISDIDDKLDHLKHQFKKRLNLYKPLQIVPYRGFGNEHELYVKGRVLEDKGIRLPEDDDTFWENILAMYKRFQSDEVPGVRIRATFQGNEQVVTSDEEGYFEIRIKAPYVLAIGRAWHEVHLELLDKPRHQDEPVTAIANVLVPPVGSLFGVISDIDDTVLISDVTNLLKAARLVFLHNARTRLPFKGISAFYRALQSGPDYSIFNPLFFVSSSSWNLYDLLVDFFSFNGIPKAPLMLRDMGTTKDYLVKSGHGLHKKAAIKQILETYPSLPFILVGDSGQHDPEIYLETIKQYPGRIKAVYIRDVSKDDRDIVVHKLSQEAAELGVEMLLVKDTEAAALHAARVGFIDAEALPDIQAEKAYDESKPTEIEALIEGEEG
jgi:phosphatidate phosphatase APP1